MPRARPLEPEERRATLLVSAKEVFASKGYHGCGVADIIGRAGVARGTFYNYFESKRAIFTAVLDGMMVGLTASARPIDVTGDIPAQVRENVMRLLHALTDDPHVPILLFTTAVGIDDEGDEALRSFYGQATARLAASLQLGQALGVVRQGDTLLLARALVGMIREPVFQATLYGEQLDHALLVEELFGLIGEGLLRAS